MHAPKMVTAERMAQAVQYDPQFAMPVRPRFISELVTVPLTDGLLIEGTDEQQLLRGRAAQTLLPCLLPLLDGTRTLAQVAVQLPDVAPTHVQQAIALLYTRGLLEDTAAEPAIDPRKFDPNLLAFLRRHVDSARVNRSGLEAAERLRQAEVAIYSVGDDDAGNWLAQLLLRCEVGMVSIADMQDSHVWQPSTRRKLTIVLVSGKEDEVALTALDEQCAQAGVPWLRVAVNAETGTADLGPYFERGETACYQCFRHANARLPHEMPVTVNDEDRAFQAKFWAAMLATEVTYFLSRIVTAATGVHTRRYDLSNWTSQALRFPKMPGCPHCRPVQDVNIGDIHTAVIFEDAVRFPSRHLNDPKSHQVHYRASNLDLAKESKRYPNAKKIALPPQTDLMNVPGETRASLSGIASNVATAPLDVTALARLLLFSGGVWHEEIPNGIRTVKPKRWAATGGNLGSAELYVAVHNVAGMAPGLHFYQVHEHQLAVLTTDWTQDDVAIFIQQATAHTDAQAPDALIIAAGALHRVASKYNAFAYRVINLDAGVALAQLQMVAQSQGLQTRLANRWADDVLAEHLQLQTLSDAVTGAVFINGVSQEKEQ